MTCEHTHKDDPENAACMDCSRKHWVSVAEKSKSPQTKPPLRTLDGEDNSHRLRMDKTGGTHPLTDEEIIKIDFLNADESMLFYLRQSMKLARESERQKILEIVEKWLPAVEFNELKKRLGK